MTKRRFNKAVKRLTHLPHGLDLIRYAANKFQAALLKLTKSTKVAYPSTIMIEVTNHCNLKCITCPREYVYGDRMNKGYMDLEKLKSIVDEVYPYIDSIGLTGLGETFLYPDLLEAAQYIRNKSKGIILSVSINAHLKNSAEMARTLAGIIDTIQISIDGIGEVYNEVRINGDYDVFLAQVKEIIECVSGTDTDLMMNMVVLKENYHQMAEVVELVGELGIRYLNMIPINLVSVSIHAIDYYNLFFTEDFSAELIRALDMAKTIPGLEFIAPDIEAAQGFNVCGLPWNHFYISWDGYMPPCCAKPFPLELSFGDVHNSSVMTALNSPGFRSFREQWFKNETPDFCAKCHIIDMEDQTRPRSLPHAMES